MKSQEGEPTQRNYRRENQENRTVEPTSKYKDGFEGPNGGFDEGKDTSTHSTSKGREEGRFSETVGFEPERKTRRDSVRTSVVVLIN
jgi:hypothetical protein